MALQTSLEISWQKLRNEELLYPDVSYVNIEILGTLSTGDDGNEGNEKVKKKTQKKQ